MQTSKDPGQVARRIFLWAMIASFCLAAAAGILALLGVSFNDTGLQVMLTTVVVGLYSLAMLCCAAVLTRPERWVGLLGVAVALLSLLWTVVMIWAAGGWDWDPTQVLLSGITLTVAFSFVSLLLALTAHRDTAIRWLLGATSVLIALTTGLTMLLIWETTWENEGFARFYGIVLILAVLTGVVTPLLSALRRRAAPADQAAPISTRPAAAAPTGPPAIDPATAAALQAEADRRGITVAQLVEPLLGMRS